MAVQIEVSGTQGALQGTVQVSLSDPNAEIASVEFYVTGTRGVKTGPLAADRVSGAAAYEKDVLLAKDRSTRVQVVVTLHDGTVLEGAPALFGVRLEPIGGSIAALSGVTVVGGARRLDVTATLSGGANWRWWAARDVCPAAGCEDHGQLDDRYLRLDWQEDAQGVGETFGTTAEPGTWNVVLQPYDVAGLPGPRHRAAVEVIP